MTADLVGLVAAFTTLELVLGPGHTGSDRIPIDSEIVLFALSLPLWLAVAHGMGLYNRDEERPEHTTVDDVVGVFQLVTMVVWLIFAVSSVTHVASPNLGKWLIF